MPQAKAILERLDGLCDIAASIFKGGEAVSPMLFLNIGTEVAITVPPMHSPEGKEEMVSFMVKMIQEDRLKEYALISEAWMACCDNGDFSKVKDHKATGASLASFPGREEAIVIHYGSPDLERVFVAKINREANKLEPWESTDMDPWKPTPTFGMNAAMNCLWQKAKTSSN